MHYASDKSLLRPGYVYEEIPGSGFIGVPVEALPVHRDEPRWWPAVFWTAVLVGAVVVAALLAG